MMKRVYNLTESAMGMSDSVWLRHANPLSGWTRIVFGLPLLCLAIWSRVWIGPVGAVIALGCVCVWVWLNPRVFPPPARFDRWMSRGVLGEYVFLRHRDRVAKHHHRVADTLAWTSLPGAILLGFGLWHLDLVWTCAGAALTALPKLWFVDRMVWIYDDFVREGGSLFGIDAKGVRTCP